MQQVLFVNGGSLTVVDTIRDLLVNCRVRLFSNDITLSPGTVKSDMVECLFGGYVIKTITALLPAYLDPDGGASAQIATQQWDSDGTVGEVVYGAWLETSGSTGVVADATNASPINIEDVAHGLTTGDVVTVVGVTGNTAANGTWVITVIDPDNFTLNGSVGNGAYVSGGTWSVRFDLIMAVKFENGVTMQNVGDGLPVDLKLNFGR